MKMRRRKKSGLRGVKRRWREEEEGKEGRMDDLILLSILRIPGTTMEVHIL